MTIFWWLWLICIVMVLRHLFATMKPTRKCKEYTESSDALLDKMETYVIQAKSGNVPENDARAQYELASIQFQQVHDQWDAALDETEKSLDKSRKWLVWMFFFLVLDTVFRILA